MNDYGSNYQIQYESGLNTASQGGFKTVQSNYPYVHSKTANQQLSVDIEPDMKYKQYEYYISISSNNRDSSNYPLHYDYRVNLDQPYKNIKKIELISAILPNQPAASSGVNILNESHLIIDIENLNYIEFPNNVGSASLKGFAILPLKPPTQSTGGFINPELGCIYHKSRVFKTPLANLDHFAIKIRDNSGELYDFGEPTGSTDKSYQNHLVFKVTVEEASRELLNQRNVY